MKKHYRNIIFIIIFSICSLSGQLTFSSSPPPSPPGHGQDGNQGGGFAPAGEGLLLLLLLGGGYGIFRVSRNRVRNRKT